LFQFVSSSLVQKEPGTPISACECAYPQEQDDEDMAVELKNYKRLRQEINLRFVKAFTN
jgi:hypothetical protein